LKIKCNNKTTINYQKEITHDRNRFEMAKNQTASVEELSESISCLRLA
jgi:hypothetical protein